MMHDDQQSKGTNRVIDHNEPTSVAGTDTPEKSWEKRSEKSPTNSLHKRVSIDETTGINVTQDSAKHRHHHHALLTPCEVEMIEELRAGDVFGTSNTPRKIVNKPLSIRILYIHCSQCVIHGPTFS